MQHNHHTIIGTAGGICLSVAAVLSKEEVFKTVLLAVIGATVSFGISLLLKYFLKRFKK